MWLKCCHLLEIKLQSWLNLGGGGGRVLLIVVHILADTCVNLPTGSIVRCYSDSYQHQLLLEQADNLGAVYDALNYVGSCPWRVNTKVTA